MIEYGSKTFYEFADGIRSIRRLSHSLDDALSSAEGGMPLPDGRRKRTAEEWSTALAESCSGFGNSFSAGVVSVYATSGGLKFAWMALPRWDKMPHSDATTTRISYQYEFRVYAKGGKFRPESTLRYALLGAGWAVTEYGTDPVIEPIEDMDASRYLDPGFMAGLLSDDLPPVPTKADTSASPNWSATALHAL